MFDKEILLKMLEMSQSYYHTQIFQKMLDEYNNNEPLIAFMKNNGVYDCTSESDITYHFAYDYYMNKIHLQVIQHDGSILLECEFEKSEELDEVFEKNSDLEIRICSVCGKPITEGYTNNDGDFYYCSDSEFENYMDLTYGEGKWRPEETGLKNWCYEYLEDDDEWYPQSSYYTDFC